MKMGCEVNISNGSFNWCEHCSGDTDGMLGQFISITDPNGTNWCLTCAINAPRLISEREYKRLTKENKVFYVEWLRSELDRLTKEVVA